MPTPGEKGITSVELTDAQLDEIAKRVSDRFCDTIAARAADKVIATVQLELGKSSLRALAYVAGAAVVAAVAAMSSHQGFWKFIFER